jgi:hypothetical protein
MRYDAVKMAADLQATLFAHPQAGPVPVQASLLTLVIDELRRLQTACERHSEADTLGETERAELERLRAVASEIGDMVPRAELEACNADWNRRYQQWGETEDRLRAEIKGLRGFKASVDEALNTGNGTYKP